MSEPLRINLIVFGRHNNGKVNVNANVTMSLYNQIDPSTGHWESVKDRLARFSVESEDAMFKITSVDKLNPQPIVEEVEMEAAA